MPSIVIMGVAGCGKSSVGAALAQALGCPLIEGDDHHPESNLAKMRAGVPLTDEDRAGWLATLGRLLAEHAVGAGAVLTCSALKRRYRDQLRRDASGLRFVWLRIDEATALARVSQRTDHLFPPSLVADQFAALESPEGEPGVLALDATAPLPNIVLRAAQWAREESA